MYNTLKVKNWSKNQNLVLMGYPNKLMVVLFSLICFNGVGQSVTWVEDIAPIIYDNCSSCHHEGAIAPFHLMSYQDVVTYSSLISHAVSERSMPPWPADPAYMHFVDEAYLEQEEIDLLLEWIDQSHVFGDPSMEPEAPIFHPSGSLLNSIDFSLNIDPYTLQSNTDEIRWFAFENTNSESIYIKGIEVIPGLDNVVHHADVFIDNTGQSVAYDISDPASGFNSTTGQPVNTYYVNAWQPGANIIRYPEDWVFVIPPGSDFVIEIHYGPGGQGQIDSTFMNFELAEPSNNIRPLRASWMMDHSPNHLIDGPLIIEANELDTFHQITQPISQDLSLLAICPHMHYLGKSYRVWYETAQGDSIPLIDIPRWDFHWQKYYAFQKIIKLPAGSILKSESVYDNTIENHDNPNNPPITVSLGSQTSDEMLLCYFIFADYQEGDEEIIMDETLISKVENQKDKSLDFLLFPNPVLDELICSVPKSIDIKKVKFSIYNQIGQKVKENRSNQKGHMVTFNLDQFKSGIYFLKWELGNQSDLIQFIKH